MSWKIKVAVPTLALGAGFACILVFAEEPIVVRPEAGTAATVRNGRVDHAAYEALLKKYVDDRGLVDYAAWASGGGPALEHYLASMAAVRPDELADLQERLAYWINVYNALTIHGMLHFYPTKSIKDHASHLGGFDFWDDVRLEVAGEERSLNSIEHEILRKMGEPRIHFAIVCASLGCPRLRNEAYAGARLENQLQEQTSAFFSDSGKFRIDRDARTVYLSKILEWFGEDFGGSDRAKLDLAARHVRSEEDRAFLQRGDLSVEYLDYDWRINEQSR
ncbi:MAG: DUF547 domain-containing protein [Planctomycetes bacterium]|nr:DUF547 domain-containing protein [Planctomycetota bacterium]